MSSDTKTAEVTYTMAIMGRTATGKFESVETTVTCAAYPSATDMAKSEGPLHDAGLKVVEEEKLVLCAIDGCRHAARVHTRVPFVDGKRLLWAELCNTTACHERFNNTVLDLLDIDKAKETEDNVRHECAACLRVMPRKEAKMCAKCKAAYYCDQKCADADADHHASLCVALVPCTFVVLAHASKSGNNATIEINDIPACTSDQTMAAWGGLQTMLTGILRRHRIRGCAIKDCDKPYIKHVCLCRSAEPKRWIVVYVCDDKDHQAKARKLATRLVKKPVS